MSQFAAIIAYLALAGAIVSWISGAWFYSRTLRDAPDAQEGDRLRWLAVVGWPFARGRLKGVPAAQVNKALVAFIACLMVAAAATSVATNLARVSR